MENFDIRYTEAQDEEFLCQWLQDKEDLRCFPFSLDEEVKMAARNWVSFYKIKSSLTATIANTPCAIGTLFLMPYRKLFHLCSFYLIVKKELRRQEIGTQMLKNLIHLAKNYFHLESVFVEIFENCPIEKLLKKNNFKQFAIQKNYVKEIDGSYKARILLEHIL